MSDPYLESPSNGRWSYRYWTQLLIFCSSRRVRVPIESPKSGHLMKIGPLNEQRDLVIKKSGLLANYIWVLEPLGSKKKSRGRRYPSQVREKYLVTFSERTLKSDVMHIRTWVRSAWLFKTASRIKFSTDLTLRKDVAKMKNMKKKRCYDDGIELFTIP